MYRWVKQGRRKDTLDKKNMNIDMPYNEQQQVAAVDREKNEYEQNGKVRKNDVPGATDKCIRRKCKTIDLKKLSLRTNGLLKGSGGTL